MSEVDIDKKERLIEIENRDKMQDAQRNMAWFSLFGMLVYPVCVLGAALTGHPDAAELLTDIAPTYFVSVAAIVAAFYGKEAIQSRK